MRPRILVLISVRVVRRVVVRVRKRHLARHAVLIDVTDMLVFQTHCVN